MKKNQVIERIKEFIQRDHHLNFEQRLVLMRGLKDLKYNVERRQDPLETILLRLRYGVKQEVPMGWVDTITVPNEVTMAGELIETPVPRGYIIRGGSYKRPGRVEKFVDKVEREKSSAPVGVKLVRL